MDYKKMITDFANNGGDEKKMWASVDVTSEAMDYLKEVAPDKYECLMRKLHESLYGKHYSDEWALYEVSKMHSTGADGNKYTGAHWTKEQVDAATASVSFPKGTTKCDRFVAYNYAYHKFRKNFSEDEILKIAYDLFFDNEGSVLIWDFCSKLFA